MRVNETNQYDRFGITLIKRPSSFTPNASSHIYSIHKVLWLYDFGTEYDSPT